MISAFAPPHPEVQLIGQSAAIRELQDAVDRAARSDAKVLITGETGVGKEVVARLIHQRSARASAEIVTINCAGLPDELIESELFGHLRGSFTDAHRDKVGLVDMAPNGTLFLDELAAMSPRMQGVLLRFLESGEVQRVGAEKTHQATNIRIVAATNRPLEQEVEAGRFREDLYFRLNVIDLAIPPLRERPEDIPALVGTFLQSFSEQYQRDGLTISANAVGVLMAQDWPGNVRELKNVIERTVVRTKHGVIRTADLPVELLPSAAGEPGSAPDASLAAELPPSEEQTRATAMLDGNESFWAAVHPQFMARDLTRFDLRTLIHAGLAQTNGDYRELVELFNMPTADYRRFMRFLHAHDCYLPRRIEVAS
jgi:DNA-binding NtrC family response regulator